jgi:hypothetical protein
MFENLSYRGLKIFFFIVGCSKIIAIGPVRWHALKQMCCGCANIIYTIHKKIALFEMN